MNTLTFDAAAVRDWMQLGERPEDATGLELVTAAVASFVDGLPDAPRKTDGTWSAQTHVAACMLAARLHRRRDTPGGIESFGEYGATYVARTDPDVARMLRIDAFTRPQIG